MIDRMTVGIRRTARPCEFECHEIQIPAISKVIHDAGVAWGGVSDTWRGGSGGSTAFVECDAEWSDVSAALAAAGYLIGAA
jgi:hypothetical protein